MALSYGFYNSYDGDRKYNTEQISSMFDGVIKDGVFDSIGEIFTTIPGDGMQVIIKTGKAWFDHTWLVNNAHYPLDLPMSDVTRNRVDAIVIETDHTVSIDGRKTSIKVISGIPAYNAQKPELVDTDFIKYHPIAYVTVKAGISEITTSDIEIVVGKQECPFVTGILDSVAIDDLFNQWDENFQTFMTTKQTEWADYLQESTDILNNWISATETAFNEWWSEVRTTLDTDTAAKLTQATIDNRNAIAAEVSRATNKENDLQNQVNTKQNKITSTGLLKGDGNGGVTSAVVGTDYADAHVGPWRIKLFNDTGTFRAPASLVNPVHVMCFGGGGAGSFYHYGGSTSSYVSYAGNCACGGSGRFTEKDVILVPNQSYAVKIGAGGTEPDYTRPSGLDSNAHYYANGSNGGQTSFGGTLVVANGGEAANYIHGGAGGAGGAGGDTRYDGSYYISNFDFNGGNGGRGYEFGGGGGGGSLVNTISGGYTTYAKGGNGGAGGTYGGGGGAGGGNYPGYSAGNGYIRREQDVGIRGAKGTYGGYGGGKISSSSTTMTAATDGDTDEPLSKWYLMLAAQYIQLTDTATAGTQVANYAGYAGGGGGGFHSNGSPAGYIQSGSPASNSGGYGGGGGGYGSPYKSQVYGRSGRGYGGFGFFDDLWRGSVDTDELYTPVNDNRWRAVIGASAGGAGHWNSSNGYSANFNGGGANYSITGKSGLCIVFYRIKE